MTVLFERWKALRDEKNETNRKIGDLIAVQSLTEAQAKQETELVQRYNDLYDLMYSLQDEFGPEDWDAHEVDQEEIRQAERQLWLIQLRYGQAKPSRGIADWWMNSN
jgi:hypothetical protein